MQNVQVLNVRVCNGWVRNMQPVFFFLFFVFFFLSFYETKTDKIPFQLFNAVEEKTGIMVTKAVDVVF